MTAPHWVWMFDFDGTISPLVERREQAQMHPDCAALLRDLVVEPRHTVAIVSSRALDDLIPRVDTPGVVLAGSSGLEWRHPDGRRTAPSGHDQDLLRYRRERVMPHLYGLRDQYGIDLEDKHWSAAVHLGATDPAHRPAVSQGVAALRERHGVEIHRGPAVWEVHFLPGMSKAEAVRTLAEYVGTSVDGVYMVYAGDDANDAEAMTLVLVRGGAAYAVGGQISVPGARSVDSPGELAAAIRRDFVIARGAARRRDGAAS